MFEIISNYELEKCYYGENKTEVPAWIIRVLQNSAQAQLKATLQDFIEWGESDCQHHYPLLKRECSKCWQELKDQVEKMNDG